MIRFKTTIVFSVKRFIVLSASAFIGISVLMYGFFNHTETFNDFINIIRLTSGALGTSPLVVCFLLTFLYTCCVGGLIGSLIGCIYYVFCRNRQQSNSMTNSIVLGENLHKFILQDTPIRNIPEDRLESSEDSKEDEEGEKLLRSKTH